MLEAVLLRVFYDQSHSSFANNVSLVGGVTVRVWVGVGVRAGVRKQRKKQKNITGTT